MSENRTPIAIRKRIVQLAVLTIAVPLVVVAFDAWWHVPGGAPDPVHTTGGDFKGVAAPRIGVLAEWAPDASDLDAWCIELEQTLSQLPSAEAASSVDHGTLLLLLGDAKRALGQTSTARAHYDAALKLHADPDHWQARDGAARLADVEHLQQRPETDRARWREAYDLQREAERSHYAGKYLDAAQHAERALEARRQLWGPDHRETADSLLRLGWLCTERADLYPRALDVLNQARGACERSYGVTHPVTGDCLYLLAALADDRGEFDAADALYEHALQVYRDTVGELSRPFARALNRQGRMQMTWWKDYASGKVARALQIREQILGRDDPDCAESLEDLAQNALECFDFKLAERLLRRAIDVRLARQGDQHPELAVPQMLLATCLNEHGDVAQAYVSYRRALQLLEETRGPDHPLAARCRTLLAMQYLSNWDFARSHRLFEQALESMRELGLQNHPQYAGTLAEQADCLRFEVMLDEHTALGLSLNEQQAAEQASRDFKAAFQAFRAIPGGDRLPRYAGALLQDAHLHYELSYSLQSREQTAAQIDEAARCIARNGAWLNPYYREISYDRGQLAKSVGDYATARVEYQTHLDLTRELFGVAHPWRTVNAIEALGGIGLHQGGGFDEFGPIIHEAFQLDHSLFLQNAPGQSDHARLGMLGRCFYALCGQLSAVELGNIEEPTYDQVMSIRGAATSCQLADRLAHDHVELQSGIENVRSARQVLKASALGEIGVNNEEDWLQRLEAASDAKELAENELALATRPFLRPEPPESLEQLQRLLPDDTILIDYLQYLFHGPPPGHWGHCVKQRRLLAYIIRRSGPPVCVRLGPVAPIDQAINTWRQAIIDFQLGLKSDIDDAARDVARLVWQPLAPHVAGGGHLVIAPDGPLTRLSFAALPGRRDGSYLLEDHTISYTVSSRMLVQVLQQPALPPDDSLIVVGGINYQHRDAMAAHDGRSAANPLGLLPPGAVWENLLGTEFEAEQVRQLAERSAGQGAHTRLLTGSGADVAAFVDALQSKPRYIHFAGHGFFADSAANQRLSGHYLGTANHEQYVLQRNLSLLSGLVLAPDPSQPYFPPVLTAEELGSFDLRGTELVVLSACETGLGNVAGGEGVIGLTRAFLTAGSRSVVSSLWKVDDAATSLLMEEFYRNLWERRLSKGEALRQAQLMVLSTPGMVSDRSQYLALRGIATGTTRRLAPAEASSSRSHPALWAAFVINGDGR